ncbi:MAG TPA: hypothetical protein DC000_04825, partial [Clostridiales bacterium]|nr:hypothetical protein [Clostridiales bacterium]
SDIPFLRDTIQYDQFKNSEKKVNLYLKNLFTKKEKYITSSVAKKFNPIWIDNKTIEYNSPNKDCRIFYIIKDID